jgi:hypothetical protein
MMRRSIAVREGVAMTAMNIVHMRVKPGREQEFLGIHQAMDGDGMSGRRNFWVVKVGERDFIVVGEWDSIEAMAAARPVMIGNLDKLRSLLEDLGGGRGVTEPWSGNVQAHLRP